MELAVALIILVIALIVLALAVYLIATIVELRKINAGLDDVLDGVAEIATKTAPVNGVLDAINVTLAAGRDLLEGLAVKKAGPDAAGLVESCFLAKANGSSSASTAPVMSSRSVRTTLAAQRSSTRCSARARRRHHRRRLRRPSRHRRRHRRPAPRWGGALVAASPCASPGRPEPRRARLAASLRGARGRGSRGADRRPWVEDIAA